MQQPFYVVREINKSDNAACQTLIQTYIMSFVGDAFWSCLFREITLQLIVIVWAFLFIIMGLPLTWCVASIPGVIAFIYAAINMSFFSKASEVVNRHVDRSWAVEVYEPYMMRTPPRSTSYKCVPAGDLPSLQNDPATRMFRKELAAMVCLSDHQALANSGWLSRFAVHPKYVDTRMAEDLIACVVAFCEGRAYDSLEIVTTECQSKDRETLIEMGFTMKQIYHHKVVANVSIMKSQLRRDLNSSSRNDEVMDGAASSLCKVVTHV